MNLESDLNSTALVHFCIRRAGAWRVPPNWEGCEWMRELAAQAAASAYEARCQFDSERGSDSASFIMSRVMARLLTRYRQEWRFARRCADTAPEDTPVTASMNRERRDHLADAVERLPNRDRWLIGQLYWHDRAQTELARELGVSQPAISKHCRKIIDRLRSTLSADEHVAGDV
jgi:RNA polymerase sigma factor (sigma-70 family)